MIPVSERPSALLERVGYFAGLTPDAPALSAGTETLTYRQLLDRVANRSWGMKLRGVVAGEVVGMCLARGVEPLITALSAWALGAAWVFLDNDYPVSRLQAIVDGSGVSWVVSDSTGPDLERVATLVLREVDALGVQPDSTPRNFSAPEDADLAYLIYTSGSTGAPKGVAVEHRNLRFFLEAFDETVLRSPQNAVWIAGAALSFDMCIPETIGALTCGGHVVVRRRLEAFAPLVRRFGGTHLQCTPTQLALFMADPVERAAVMTLQHLIVAGETLPVSLAAEVRSNFGGRFTNVYGPTEITVYATAQEITDPPTGSIPIGVAYPGIVCEVVDPESLLTQPRGDRGELVIGGPGVSRGYYRRDDLTARSFIELPVGPAGEPIRVYRTGDLAEIARNGTISMFGRIDHQVKVRGQRIELGEIEAVLSEHDAVQLAVTVVVGSGAPSLDDREAPILGLSEGLHDSRLVSHVVAVTGATIEPADLRAFCRERLPEFMVPAFVVLHDALPYTPTGKINRTALTDLGIPTGKSTGSSVDLRPDGSVDERLLRMIRIWEDVLGVAVNPDDNFFEIGGHSILGVELLVRVRRVFGRQLPLGSLIGEGTPRRMLAAVHNDVAPVRCLQQLRGGSGPATVIIHGAGGYLLRLYALAQQVTPGRPVYGLQAFGLHPGEVVDETTQAIAKRYLGELAVGNLFDDNFAVLIGYSGGGLIAAEMAAQICETGGTPPIVVALDTDIPKQIAMSRRTYWMNLLINVARGGVPVLRTWRLVRKRRSSEQLRRTRLLAEAAEHGFVDIHNHLTGVLLAYRPRPIAVRFGLIRVTEESPSERPDFGWSRFVRSHYAERTTPGDHFSILEEPLLQSLSRAIAELIAELSADAVSTAVVVNAG